MSEISVSQEAVWQIFYAIPDLAGPDRVQSSLRAILGDPSLELFWWDWERECHVDVDGKPAELGEQTGERTVTRVDYESRKIGAIVHDPELLDAPGFLDTFVPTMRIAMERDRLHRDLVDKLDQLKASRLRIVEAAEQERRRLERNLHDGAQQRLVVLLLELRRLEARVREDPELGPLVRHLREDAEATIQDLRDLARGLHPPLLAERGLAAAVRSGIARSAIPVELDLRLESALPATIEAAAYYVCAEAITNAAKHARASTIWLSIDAAEGALRVEVRDDGVGGAAADAAGERTGLRGLRDRVEALDGRLEIESPPGRGTRLVATLPVENA